MGHNLLILDQRHRSRQEETVSAAVRQTHRRLFVWFSDLYKAPQATHKLLKDLSELLKPVANSKPRLDFVPLLPFASWTPEHVANIKDLQGVFCLDGNKAMLEELNALRKHDLPRLQSIELSSSSASVPAEENEPELSESDATDSQQPLAFEHVAVGGTFDRLHVGHRLLLAATALICTKRVYVGVTGDRLLEKKRHRELLEPYEERAAAAVSYLKAVRPALDVQTGALLDPKAPTAAATEAGMQALVVSRETVPGAEAINQWRREHGFAPLAIVVVDLVEDGSAALGGQKVSSTALREQDAAHLQHGT